MRTRVVDLCSWRIAGRDPHGVTLRPSISTLLSYLAGSIFLGLLILGAWYILVVSAAGPASNTGQDSHPELQHIAEDFERDVVERGVLTQQEVDDIKARGQQRAAEGRARSESLKQWPIRIFYGVAGVLGSLAVIGPVSLIWQKVRIRRDMRGNIAVRRRGVFGRLASSEVPLASLAGIAIRVQEKYHRSRNMQPERIGFEWRVALQENRELQPGVSLPMPILEFIVHLQKDRPWEKARPPEPAELLLSELERLTGLTANRQVEFIEVSGAEYGLLGSRVRMSSSMPEVTSVQQTYRSIDEMPEEIRMRFANEIEEARRTGQTVIRQETMSTHQTIGDGADSKRITYRDSSGQTHIFDSVDAMPPAIRAKYEAFQAKRRKS